MANKVKITIQNLIGTVIVTEPKHLKELEKTLQSAVKSVANLSLETLEEMKDTTSQSTKAPDKKH
jgi:hypothetical protein